MRYNVFIPTLNWNMYYLYLIMSEKDGKLYTGSTTDLKRRFQEHNKGLCPSTKKRGPFKLVYYEAYLSEKDARIREHNLKLRANALGQLKRRIKNSLVSNNSK